MGAKSGKGGGGKGGGGGGGAAAAKKGGGGALSIAGTPAGIRSLLDTEEARLLAQAEKSRSFGDYVDILARKGFNGEKMWDATDRALARKRIPATAAARIDQLKKTLSTKAGVKSMKSFRGYGD